MNYFKENVKFLRDKAGLSQHEIASRLDLGRSTWAGYETGDSQPNISMLYRIAEYFDIGVSQLLDIDISTNVHLIGKGAKEKKGSNVHAIVHPTVHPTGKKEHKTDDFTITMVAEPDAQYATKSSLIPITDISVAAGTGALNSDYIEKVDSIRLPATLLKVNKTYLCVKIKGLSMSPTLQDGGYAIIRLLDKQEWSKMHDERIFVVSDNEGQSYLKRIKNRFKQGFIVLRSDNPDQASFPAFNLEASEINTIWYVEWYFSAKMPNIHDQYYIRLQRLEDKVDLMEAESKRINRKLN